MFENHLLTKLSALDMRMIESIPQGGNWTSIPESVQSKRIEQIRKMSEERGLVRTSYYGRLRPDQPAYTIATYYNRPGNGTNIHPQENRTITSREAARLQSFPDYFKFCGPEGAVRNQIGNAVPPLLAYNVAKSFKESELEKTFLDLFCGAGGLSLGVTGAGYEMVGALDHDKWAMETHALNFKNGENVCGDITDPEIFNSLISNIKKSLGKRKLGLIVGGPPCQGFSTAGWRNSDDERNSLVTYYLKAVEILKPQGVIIENVEGLLSMNEGKVVNDILRTLESMGYQVNTPWLLRAEEYGVPQMRKRAFITATKKGFTLPVRPSPLFKPCKGRRELPVDRKFPNYPITVKEAISDLPSLGKKVIKNDKCEFNRNFYSEFVRGAINFDRFYSQSIKLLSKS